MGPRLHVWWWDGSTQFSARLAMSVRPCKYCLPYIIGIPAEGWVRTGGQGGWGGMWLRENCNWIPKPWDNWYTAITPPTPPSQLGPSWIKRGQSYCESAREKRSRFRPSQALTCTAINPNKVRYVSIPTLQQNSQESAYQGALWQIFIAASQHCCPLVVFPRHSQLIRANRGGTFSPLNSLY